MIILTTAEKIKVNNDTYRTNIISIQYFEDDEEEKVRLLCKKANEYWRKRHNDVYCYTSCYTSLKEEDKVNV